ncbi:MAG TPA: ChbG/HpnK family deacetylase [Candidatus Angelobacter sp.]|nr:ChbG/HpnK family deacetylase [Candidatus Angelobacter sp.]
MRRLIVNADDFGLTAGVNRAIVEANRSGIVTSATIMANAPAYAEAGALARATPTLLTGCHVVLIDGQPLTSGAQTLINGATFENTTGATSRFRSSLKDFARAAVGKKLSAAEIQKEAEAQIARIQSAGITVTHVDSHKHTHMFPQVLRPVLRAAMALGVKAVRNPFEPIRAWPITGMLGAPGMWLRCAGVMSFQLFAREFSKAVREEGMYTTDGTVGIAATGMLNQKTLSAILMALPEGTWELVCHPGYSDDDLRAAGTRLLKSREVELETLTSPETKRLLGRQNIQLVSYADLPPARA